MTETILSARKPKGYSQLAVSSTAVGLSAIPSDAIRAIISVATDAIRYRDDGTNPTASVGMPVAANATIELPSRESIVAFKAIRVTTDAVLNISYYGE
jgi:hypothetical protein